MLWQAITVCLIVIFEQVYNFDDDNDRYFDCESRYFKDE